MGNSAATPKVRRNKVKAVPEKAQAALMELPVVSADLVRKMVKPVDLPEELLLQQALVGEVGTITCFACSGKGHTHKPEQEYTNESRSKENKMKEKAASQPVFSHRAPDGTWDLYTQPECKAIERSIRSSPDGGTVMLPDSPFEVRWGRKACSRKMPKSPETKLIQVNTKTGNTRVVRREYSGGLPSPQLQAVPTPDSALAPSAPPFSHRAPNGVWVGYSPKLCPVIAGAMTANPEGGVVELPGIPFQVRWGSRARSERMPKPPATGIIQVNIKSGNTRVVRRAGGSVVANADGSAVSGWVFEDDSGGWSSYDDEMAAMLSQASRDGRGALVRVRGRVTIRTGAQREYEYEVDLATMTQRNLATNKLRKIKRLGAAPPALALPASAPPASAPPTSAPVAPSFPVTADRITDSCWVCKGKGTISKWLPQLRLPKFDAEEVLRTKDDDELQCVVCYGDAKYALSSSGCGHYFCDACIDGSLGMMLDVGQFPAYCPQCRADGVLVDGRATTGRIDIDALAFLALRGACTKQRAVRIAQQDAKARGEASLECMVCPGGCGALLLTDHPSYGGLRIGEYYNTKVNDLTTADDSLAVCLAECPKCAATACVKCHRPAAPPHVCADIWDKVGEATTEDLRLMARIGKACPACGNFIAKNGGCNSMMCGTDAHGSRDKALENGGCAHKFSWMTLEPLGFGAPGRPDNGRQVKFMVGA